MTQPFGRVYLVGAGCGPAEWITLRGYRLLQTCDAVVYDDLIAPELLDTVPPQAQKLYMGKRLGRHSAPQEDISQTLISLAQAGHTVVRLKGGDPFVFGRGGEEIQALQRVGIPFEVVPGISSAIAIPGQAGIPVTHRGLSRSFHVITAHTKDGASDQLDRLAGAEGTLVILMGLSQLPAIVQRLMSAGRAPDTPAAVVSGGCAPHPAAVRAPLEQLPEAAERAGVLPPAVIVVGETAALEGVRVALTGTPAIQARLRRPLIDLGARPFSLMTTQVVEQETNFDWNLLAQGPNWVVLTSQNGVECFFRALDRAEVDLRSLAPCRFAVIGPATGAALRRHGISADLCPEVHTTQGLADPAGAGLPRRAGAAVPLPAGLPGTVPPSGGALPGGGRPPLCPPARQHGPGRPPGPTGGGGLPPSLQRQRGGLFAGYRGGAPPLPHLRVHRAGDRQGPGRPEHRPLPHRPQYLRGKRGSAGISALLYLKKLICLLLFSKFIPPLFISIS